jgi:hypothetical protein
MSPSAQQTHLEFVRLAAEEPSSLYFEQFLRSGYSAWPDSYQQRFPALSRWPGIAGLQTRLKQLAGGPASDQVLISSRSAELMKLAARVLCKSCRGIFTTDFSWPTYQNILQHEAKRTDNRVHVASLRTSVLRERMPPDQLIADIVREFIHQNCDGLFLPAVDNLGVRLPIADIVAAIRQQSELRFVVVDAAQALAHVPVDDCLASADFTIAGCHKWLRGYFPLGLAFFGQPGTREFVGDTAANMLRTAELDDGLLRFCTQLTDANLDGYSETVNLGPLFSCCGAAADTLASGTSVSESIVEQIANSELVCDIARHGHWRPLVPRSAFRSGILLLEHRGTKGRFADGDAVRRHFQDRGIIATGYDGGSIRLSMPKHRFPPADLRLVHDALVTRYARTTAHAQVLSGVGS